MKGCKMRGENPLQGQEIIEKIYQCQDGYAGFFTGFGLDQFPCLLPVMH